MPRGSSPKRERQYEHIKTSARERGASEGRAEQIAARTVNKQRARSGEAKSASPGSKRGSSPSSRGDHTYRELYDEAKRRDIRGRSSMDKAQLERALSSSGRGGK